MTNHPTVSVSSTMDSDTILQKAYELAKKLNLPFYRNFAEAQTDLILAYTDYGLKLHLFSTKSKKNTSLLFVDFVHGKNKYRLINNFTTKQPLARAAGIKPGFRPVLLDATAGLGADAFVLAILGCTVTLIERSPLVAAILSDGLKRGLEDNSIRKIIQHMSLHYGDTLNVLHTLPDIFHTIYLDPMYPHRTTSALNKQTMRTLRDLVGDDTDAELLLDFALQRATQRVVVKRPQNAPLLSKIKPSHTITMKNSRFDIYLTF